MREVSFLNHVLAQRFANAFLDKTGVNSPVQEEVIHTTRSVKVPAKKGMVNKTSAFDYKRFYVETLNLESSWCAEWVRTHERVRVVQPELPFTPDPEFVRIPH